MDTIQQTARVVTSKPVQRAAVNAFLLVCSALSLLVVAAAASVMFFQNHVPDQMLSTPVHLQYGSGLNPYGLVSLQSPAMKAQQEYDVSVTLSMPRSPPNVERGNFMLSIYLLDTALDRSLEDDASKFASEHESFGLTRTVLFRSRRPVLIPYVDPIVSFASRVLFLFWHMMFPSVSHSSTLNVPLADRIAFPRLSGPPKTAYLEVEAGQTIQIYSVELILTAQLSGLRYLMFHYRLLTFIVFTSLFWILEVLFMTAVFLFFKVAGGVQGPGREQQDTEREPKAITGHGEYDRSDYSDQALTFPSYGRQSQLKSEPVVKRETSQQEDERLLSELPMAGAEADDEDDDGDETLHQESGVSSSYSAEGRSSVWRRPPKPTAR